MTGNLFHETIAALEKRGIMPESAPDLARMKTALHDVGFFQWPFWKKHQNDLSRIVVVAGTNGKGSTCAALDALLRDAGESVGFYSSPHLVHYTERVRRNGEPIPEDLFVQAYKNMAEKTSSIPLTHFELLTLMALWVFCSGQAVPMVDRLILEVGLGGLWDATNAVPHGVAVISKLGLDHTNLLGPTLNHVARNKLGIVPEEGIVVHQKFPSGTEEAVMKCRSSTRCRWVQAPDFQFEMKPGHPPQTHVITPWGSQSISLAGGRGAENSVLALQIFEALGFSPKNHLGVLQNVNWPGRMERVSTSEKGTPIYFSGDHNPQGMESLLELLPSYPRKNLHVICGIGKDKDRDGILGRLFSLPDTIVYLTQTPFRGLALEKYENWLKRAEGTFDHPREALAMAKDRASTGDMILVTGSLYLMGSLNPYW